MSATIDPDEAKQTAQAIADRFGETTGKARSKLAKLAKLYGPAWMSEVAERAEREITTEGPHVFRQDGERRTRGGVFFAVAKQAAFEGLKSRTIPREVWFKAFGHRRKPSNLTETPSTESTSAREAS
jgi:hypothetical protein